MRPWQKTYLEQITGNVSFKSKETELLIGGAFIKHQIEPYSVTRDRGVYNVKFKRMVVPLPIMDALMASEPLEFRLTGDNGDQIEGECYLQACAEGGSSAHYRALEDALFLVKPK
ncbi:hypothetical protein [Bacillus phage CP-51]|uniref:Uncharacterized protein n=1 Tax=Bacillus phage CP-51 TaxID=1391188 RepID=A0A068EMY9_9CAUD|nr:hypothetical protein OZ73_gp190 [Bacillus phage CP-51]AID50625.1 hypothetical protein [Bacillus phage CP-51]